MHLKFAYHTAKENSTLSTRSHFLHFGNRFKVYPLTDCAMEGN